MTTLTGMNPVFEPVLAELSERHRDEVLAAFAAVEHSPEPVPEAQLLALRDATLRRSLDDLLHRVGRTLIPVETAWTSGYRDEVAAELAQAGWHSLPATDRAVLVLVLIHSVAIPRSRGLMQGDGWTSGQPTMVSELLEASSMPPTWYLRHHSEIRLWVMTIDFLLGLDLITILARSLRPTTLWTPPSRRRAIVCCQKFSEIIY